MKTFIARLDKLKLLKGNAGLITRMREPKSKEVRVTAYYQNDFKRRNRY
jgi:hypothetical protein